jgi:hypothetical protein
VDIIFDQAYYFRFYNAGPYSSDQVKNLFHRIQERIFSLQKIAFKITGLKKEADYSSLMNHEGFYCAKHNNNDINTVYFVCFIISGTGSIEIVANVFNNFFEQNKEESNGEIIQIETKDLPYPL